MLYIDIKYTNMLAPRLRNFKRKSEYLWNFSCAVCGDSSKNKLKARGYIYKVKTGLFVKCHNCGYSTNVGNLIKYVDPTMYQEYVLENYKEGGVPRSAHKSTDVAIPAIIKAPDLTDSILDSIKRLDTLPIDHPAVKYVLNRKIPSSLFHLLYFAPKFKRYVNTVVPDKFKMEIDEHPRLIIPYFNRHGKCFAFQGRAFGKEDPKYYTIKVDDTEEKIYGLDRINFAKRVYILEGPLDSLFIPNAVAVSGSSFSSPTVESLKANATVVYDNEPRSKELTKLIKKTIDQGFSVCLWPDTVEEKDVNEMIMAGRTVEEIMDIIRNNTYSGVEAQLKYATWRKCE
jgi:transcription elongation factor Elf1